MDECEGFFDGSAHGTTKCENCGGYLRDHYWASELFSKEKV